MDIGVARQIFMTSVLPGDKHLTASVWLVTKNKPRKVLLMHHKKLGKWLQPGGHVERDENPVEAIIRETQEETGIDISFLKDKIQIVDKDGTFLPIPRYFMEHAIPAYGDQPQHFHLDMMYVLTIPEQKLTNNLSESHNIGWFTKEEAFQLPIHGDTHVILEEILS